MFIFLVAFLPCNYNFAGVHLNYLTRCLRLGVEKWKGKYIFYTGSPVMG